jgi:two-component system phosphate regulon response regulator OmpR
MLSPVTRRKPEVGMPKGRILVVDDEAEVRTALRLGLQAGDWQVVEASDSSAMFEALARQDFDLVTLDVLLGQEDGLLLARRLRAERNLPVLMVTGKGQPVDRVEGLDHGADDYVVKPFLMREVLLRIDRILERYQRQISVMSEGQMLFDHSSFDPRNGMVRHADGSVAELTGTEQRILELFTRRPGIIISRDDISQELHGRDWSPYDRSIDGHVARLRRKIEPEVEAPVLIRSVRGVGYVFTGDVRKKALPAG